MRKILHSIIGLFAGLVVIAVLYENTASALGTCWIAGSIVSYFSYHTLNYIRRHEARS